MGQQQLLLIVLGVIIVGIAVAVGINMMSSGAGAANQDAVMADLQKMASDAQAWYKKPTSIGGGGRTFVALTADAAGMGLLNAPVSNANGTYSISTAGSATTVVFTGVGTEDQDGDGTNVTITMTVTSAAMTPAITNR